MNSPWRLQMGWYVILMVMLVVGLVLVVCNPASPPWVHRLSEQVQPDAWSALLGIYLISIVVTHLVIFYSLRGMGELLKLKGSDTRADLWGPTLLGICESVMYPTALFMQKGEFIGVWLAVKVAGQWVRWGGVGNQSESTNSEVFLEAANEGRRRFNRFLVGNALSIVAAVVTYGAMKVWALK